MIRKHRPQRGAGEEPRAVESIEIVTAVREGRLTRGLFDAWHSRRRPGTGFVVTLKEKKPRLSARRHRAR